MKTNNISMDGNEIAVGQMTIGQTMKLDHCEQTFTVKIRSLSPKHHEQVKALIQQKFEVVAIEETERNNFVRVGLSD